MTAKEFADAELIHGGKRVIHIVDMMTKKDKSKNKGKAHDDLRLPPKHASKKGNARKTKGGAPMLSFPNMSKGESLSWNNAGTARDLFQQVLDEQNLQDLMQHGVPEEVESSDLVNTSQSEGGAHTERQPRSHLDVTKSSLGNEALQRANTVGRASGEPHHERPRSRLASFDTHDEPGRRRSSHQNIPLQPNLADGARPGAGQKQSQGSQKGARVDISIGQFDDSSMHSSADDDDEGDGEDFAFGDDAPDKEIIGEHLLERTNVGDSGSGRPLEGQQPGQRNRDLQQELQAQRSGVPQFHPGAAGSHTAVQPGDGDAQEHPQTEEGDE